MRCEMPDKVIAKFVVNETARRHYYSHQQVVRLQAVYGGGPENRSFAAATPQGSMEIVVDNPLVEGFFELGGEYYITLERAPQPAVGE